MVKIHSVEEIRKGLKTILVPTDFSESSSVALRIAIELARQQNALLCLLHVVPFRQDTNSREKMERQLAEIPGAESVEIIREIRKGNILREILKMETERAIDLIVIARHRKTGFLYTLFQSITENIKKKARCSVLVVGM